MEQVKNETLTLSDYRIELYLMATIGFGNFVLVNQAELARELNLDKQTVHRSIKRLIALNILIPGPKSGKSNTYSLSPALCYMGKIGAGVKERARTIQEGKAKRIKFSEVQTQHQASL
jgi:hypothetical protein